MLRPLDLMQPYRLEMGTKIAVGDSKSLCTPRTCNTGLQHGRYQHAALFKSAIGATCLVWQVRFGAMR